MRVVPVWRLTLVVSLVHVHTFLLVPLWVVVRVRRVSRASSVVPVMVVRAVAVVVAVSSTARAVTVSLKRALMGETVTILVLVPVVGAVALRLLV